jgi:DeoR/GlpR family transcriptional regulator of sugar metabolism
MKSSLAEIADRRERLATLLRKEGYLSVSALSDRFKISEATVRRDLNALEKENRITRTYGGALSEFDALFVPFYQRNTQNREAKNRIAHAVLPLLQENQTLFLDAGSTVFAVAEAVAESGLDVTVVTNSLPVAETLAAANSQNTHLLGGCLLPHQLVVVGAGSSLSLTAWQFDLALLSAEGMNAQGLWNSETEITDFQRHVCGRSASTVFCVDSSKIGRLAASFLLPWSQVERVVSDATDEQVNGLGADASEVEWIAA